MCAFEGTISSYLIKHSRLFCTFTVTIARKNTLLMKFKQTPHEVKDLDGEKGIVEAYANVYNVEDADGDISMPGSFEKTVQEQRKRIRVLKDHISTVSLGVPLELDAEDPYGLKTVTQFNMEKDASKDMFTDIQLMMEHDMNAELSIGHEVLDRDEEDQRKVTQYKLYEYSFLTGWAANALATTEGVKSLKTKQGIVDLIVKAYDMDYSDERLQKIEDLLKSLDDNQSPDKATEDKDGIDDIEPIQSSFDELITKIKLDNDQL